MKYLNYSASIGVDRLSFALDDIMSEPEFDDVDEGRILFDASDEDLERAASACAGGVPTLLGTYCFTCPVN
jgi:hypothetical protein